MYEQTVGFPEGFGFKVLQDKSLRQGADGEKKLQPIMAALRNVHSAIDDMSLDRQRQTQSLLGSWSPPCLGCTTSPSISTALPAA